MSKVITDDEIQQLLNVILVGPEFNEEESSETTDNRKVRIYDFKRPDKFTKLEIKYLIELLNNFAVNFATQICQNYQMIYEPKIELSSMDVLSWETYTSSLPQEGFLSYYFDWFDGKVALACEKVSTMANLYNNTSGKQNNRLISNIELSLPDVKYELNKFAESILSNGLYAFDNDLYKRLPGNPEREEDLKSKYLSNIENFFNVNKYDMMIYATFSFDEQDGFSLAIDTSALKQYLNRYNGKEVKSTRLTASNFGDVNVHVSAVLGQTDKKLEDLVGLGPGAIIELDKMAGEPTDIVVGNKIIAKGEVVVYGDNMAVRILEVV